MAGALRADGRAALEYREVSVRTRVLPQCYGSARAVVGGGLGGGTEVLCALTARVGPAAAAGCDVGVGCAAAARAGDERARATFAAAVEARLAAALADFSLGL